jgi:hypothetical protein
MSIRLTALLLLAAAARAERVTPLAILDPGVWDFARDPARLAREYVNDQITLAADPVRGQVMQWDFKLRSDNFADLFLRRSIAEPFDRLRLKVRNLGPALTLGVKVGDARQSEWLPRRVPLAGGGDWQTVDFPLTEWKAAGWTPGAGPQLEFPANYLAVIAFDVQPGPAYQLQIAEVSIVQPDPVAATAVVTGLPAAAKAGDPLTAGIDLTPAGAVPPLARAPRLGLVIDGAIAAAWPIAWDRPPAEWQPGQTVHGAVAGKVSMWQGSGSGEWRLLAPVLAVNGSETNRLGAVTVAGHRPAELAATVRPYHGAPTLHLNGQPVTAMTYSAYGPRSDVFADFNAAGVRLYEIMGTPTSHGYGLARDAWLGPDHYDFSELDERIRMVLEACPEGYVLPRVYVSAPPWWLDQHPEAVVTYDPGDGHPKPFLQDGRHVPSLASAAWRAAVDDSLKRLWAHLASQPFGDRVLGLHIACETTEEWMFWGANDDMWCDYSAANTDGFRRWLTARYHDDAGLRAAWHDAAVTLATANVPPRRDRARSVAGTLRDPAVDQPSIDYVRYIADLTAATIDEFCGAVKQASGGQRLAGVFYGYLLQLFGQRQQNAAHLGFDAVVRSPNVDFLCSPTSYAFRHLGDGTSHFMAPVDSVLAHGKLWFDENDIRTSLSQGAIGEWGRPADVAGDKLQQRRELANVLAHGVEQWWFDVGNNRYNDPGLMAEIKHLTTVAGAAQAADRSPLDQVAMVLDARGLALCNVGDMYLNDLMLAQIPPLARIGAPVGHYELHDVDQLKRHRLILFAPLYDPTPAQRAAIEALKSEGRVLVFTNAPAPYRDGQWRPDLMAETCGLTLAVEDREQHARVTPAGGAEALASGWPAYGTDFRNRPAILGDDPAATVLGRLPDGRPGLLMRRYPTWTAVWSAAPALPTALLVKLAQLAGVHRYIDTPDVVWASRGLLAVSVNQAGRRAIRLPAPARITDLYGGKLVAEHAESFEADLAAADTGLWRIEP